MSKPKTTEAKTSAFIRTLSYHDFLEDNSHPTKEEIVKAKHKLNLFNSERWVSEAEFQKQEQEWERMMDKMGKECSECFKKSEAEFKRALEQDFEFLWKEYGLADDATLTDDAKVLKCMLLDAVKKVGLERLAKLEAENKQLKDERRPK